MAGQEKKGRIMEMVPSYTIFTTIIVLTTIESIPEANKFVVEGLRRKESNEALVRVRNRNAQSLLTILKISDAFQKKRRMPGSKEFLTHLEEIAEIYNNDEEGI